MSSPGLPVFEKFIAALRAIRDAQSDNRNPKAKTVIERFGPTQVPYGLVA